MDLLTTVAVLQAASSSQGEIAVTRPGSCRPRPAIEYVVREDTRPVYVLSQEDRLHPSVAAFLAARSRGWASRRILSRFDLIREPDVTPVVNGGQFCTDIEGKE